MKVILKRYEHLAVEHAKRFAKGWDYFCIATGAFLSGYRAAKKDAKYELFINTITYSMIKMNPEDIEKLGEETVAQEVTDGMHQLSVESFIKWQEQINNLDFKEALKVFLPQYNFTDLRVDVSNDGVVSFQGTAQKSSSSYKDYNDNG